MYNWGRKFILFIRDNIKMKLPEQYQNLNVDEKRIIVANLISEFWDQKIQWLADRVWDAQIEFLFNYFFTESKEDREKMWSEMQRKYEAALQEIEVIAEQIQMMDLKYRELLWTRADVKNMESFSSNSSNVQ